MKRMDYEKYISPSPWLALVIIGFFIIFPIITTYVILFEREGITDMKGIVIFDAIMWLIIFILYHVLYGSDRLRFKKRKKQLAERGLLKIADDDFSTAEQLFDNNIKVGDKFIFAKGKGKIIIISDVKSIKRKKTIYTGERNETVWSLIVLENGNRMILFSSTFFSPIDWERTAEKLKSLNRGIIVDREIEIERIHVTASD